MSAPHVTHLLAADGLLTERYRGRISCFTLCAQVLAESELSRCEDEECGCEVRYCPECIRSAIGWNAELDGAVPSRSAPGSVSCYPRSLDSPEVTAAKRLLDTAKASGFAFERTEPGADAPLLGVRETVDWVDEIVLAGFWEAESCCAVRRRRSSLLVPGGLPVAQRVSGDALTVLHTVLSDWPTT